MSSYRATIDWTLDGDFLKFLNRSGIILCANERCRVFAL